jgi:primosomal protein N'
MIAEVYPILKLPRKCTYFDYDIPEFLAVNVGDLVRVPFKGRETLGLVKNLKDNSDAKKLLSINSVAKSGYITPDDIHRYEQIASRLVQAPSSILHAVFPTSFFDGAAPTISPTASSHIRAEDIHVLEQCLTEIGLNHEIAIAGDRDIGFALAYALRRKRDGQMLILLPRERDAELLARYVNFGANTALLHGKTSPKDKARITEAWRQGKIGTLIGTRLASLLPAHKLNTVLVLEAGSEEHFNERRNPRFDAREAATLLARQHGAHAVFFDAYPRLEELWRMPLLPSAPKAEESSVINLGSSEEITNEALLSDSLIFAIEKALQSQKKVLLYLNRKGVAKRLQCGKCGHVPVCGTCGHVPIVRHDDLVCPNCQTEMWIPTECPLCRKPKLGLRGIGGAKMRDNLRKLFPQASVGKIEKGDIQEPGADILIVTEYFFSSFLEPFSPQRFGVVADLAGDISLHASDFRGAEATARKLHRLLAFAKRQNAEAYIQTWLPEIVRPMLDLQAFSITENELRKQYRLPPAQDRYLLPGATLMELPPELQAVAIERGEALEIITPCPNLFTLPDTLKIHYDGTYVQSHESTPHSG